MLRSELSAVGGTPPADSAKGFCRIDIDWPLEQSRLDVSWAKRPVGDQLVVEVRGTAGTQEPARDFLGHLRYVMRRHSILVIAGPMTACTVRIPPDDYRRIPKAITDQLCAHGCEDVRQEAMVEGVAFIGTRDGRDLWRVEKWEHGERSVFEVVGLQEFPDSEVEQAVLLGILTRVLRQEFAFESCDI